MKNILFLLPVLMTAMSCEWSYALDYKFENQTNSIIVVTFKRGGYGPPITIAPTETNKYSDAGLTGGKTTLSDWYADCPKCVLLPAGMTIDGENVPEDIFQRRFWEFSSTEILYGVYKLTITDELLEIVRSENN